MSQQQSTPTPEQLAAALYQVTSKEHGFEVFVLADGGLVLVVRPKAAPRFNAFIKSLGPPAEVSGEPPKN